jgi:hypothetical protein
MGRLMNRSRTHLATAAVAACSAGAAAAPALAEAAAIEVDRRCYEPGAPVAVRAVDFAPGAALTVTLDGTVLRHRDGSLPTANGVGLFENRFSAPGMAGGQRQRRIALEASDGTSGARTSFHVSAPAGGTFAPSRGDPRTLAVRFSVWGFALADGRNHRVHLHWLAPGGAVRDDVPLGRTSGPCGTLTTARRRIFPFAAERGRWTLVLDTHARYRRGAAGPSVRIPVRIREVRR